MNSVLEIAMKAKEAQKVLSVSSSELKNRALSYIADSLESNCDDILSANAVDISNAEANGTSPAMIDRLRLTKERVRGMAEGVRDVMSLNDPVGKVLEERELYNGLNLKKVTVSIGVIGIIFEARPNVTSDAAALCLKSGNVTILRGGKEAINSNIAIENVMREAIKKAGLPEDCIQLIKNTDRRSSTELMQLVGYVDLLIPRGGAGLIRATVENAKVPVIETGTGNCHAFIDESADINMAAEIVYNAKCSRPSVCNALESLLVHKNIAAKVLPAIAEKLKEKETVILGCQETCRILPNAIPATEEDYATEFLDYKISVKVVGDIDQAIDHIMKYTTGHSECIVTENAENAEKFLNKIDAAAVYLNASTRFTDGGEFGLGAEIGISTQKIHARGPMGLEQLTSYKYVVTGNGQVR